MYLFFFFFLRISYHLLNDLNSSSCLNFIGIFIVPLVLYLSQMNVSIGFPIVFFVSFGLTPPGYLYFIVAHIVTFSRDIGSASSFCFSSLRSSRSDYQHDQLFFPFDFVLIPFAHYQSSNHILILRGFCLFFSLFSSSPLLRLLVPESLWIFLIKLPRFLLLLSLYI